MAVTYEYVGKTGGGKVETVSVGSFTGTGKTIHTVVLDRTSIVSAALSGFSETVGSTARWGSPAPSIEIRPSSGGVWGATRFGASVMVHSSTVNVPEESQTQNARYLSISAKLPAGTYTIVVNSGSSSRTCTVDTAQIVVTPND